MRSSSGSGDTAACSCRAAVPQGSALTARAAGLPSPSPQHGINTAVTTWGYESA
jgi:hypothetical protein